MINIIFKLNVTNNRKYFLMTFLMSKHHNVCYRHHGADYTLWTVIQFTAFILSYHDKIRQCKEVVNFKVYSLFALLYLIMTEASRKAKVAPGCLLYKKLLKTLKVAQKLPSTVY